jgi:hypothetical protein
LPKKAFSTVWCWRLPFLCGQPFAIKYQGKKVGRKGFGVNSQSNHLRLVLFADSGTDAPQSVNGFALRA